MERGRGKEIELEGEGERFKEWKDTEKEEWGKLSLTYLLICEITHTRTHVPTQACVPGIL